MIAVACVLISGTALEPSIAVAVLPARHLCHGAPIRYASQAGLSQAPLINRAKRRHARSEGPSGHGSASSANQASPNRVCSVRAVL